MNEAQLKVLEDKLRGDLEAIERVRALLAENGVSEIKMTKSSNRGDGFGRGEVLAKVSDFVRSQKGTFTIRDIGSAFEQKGSPIKGGSLQTALARLVETGVIEIVTRGAGRKPTIYRKGKDAKHQVGES